MTFSNQYSYPLFEKGIRQRYGDKVNLFIVEQNPAIYLFLTNDKKIYDDLRKEATFGESPEYCTFDATTNIKKYTKEKNVIFNYLGSTKILYRIKFNAHTANSLGIIWEKQNEL